MEIRSSTIGYATMKKNEIKRRRRKSTNTLKNIYYRKKRRKRKKIKNYFKHKNQELISLREEKRKEKMEIKAKWAA